MIQNHHVRRQHNQNILKSEYNAVVLKAHSCRRSAMLYLANDAKIVELVTAFYANLNDTVELDKLCTEIVDHCNGIIK